MNKLYVGNLSPSVTVEDLKQLFCERDLPVADQVLLKSGYGFVDFPDQNWAIKAIETLSGKVELHGKVIEVDYSVPKKLRATGACLPRKAFTPTFSKRTARPKRMGFTQILRFYFGLHQNVTFFGSNEQGLVYCEIVI
ncbi:unnamed protein product [Arctogadus glacialis]